MATRKDWIQALRLRTLPLALSCVVLGSLLAAETGQMQWPVTLLALLTIALLQILSNLANDYGDSLHGADSISRSGPSRAVQTGAISAASMKKAVMGFAIAAFVSGMCLLWVALGAAHWETLLFFFLLGLASIWAAVAYTATENPYGYAGLGDIFVLLFFGFVGVLGTFYLQTLLFSWVYLLPAFTCGAFSVAVLNVNNVRDIESDKLAGKNSIPVRIGREKAVYYHWLLLVSGIGSATVFNFLLPNGWTQWLFLITLPLLARNGMAVAKKHDAKQLDPYLKQMALTTLLFVLTFGIGRMLAI